MKRKNSGKGKAAEAKANRVESWWANLSATDKQFVYELGQIVGNFKAGLAGNVLPAEDAVERVVGKLIKQVGVAYDKGAVNWPQNPPERRGLN